MALISLNYLTSKVAIIYNFFMEVLIGVDGFAANS